MAYSFSKSKKCLDEHLDNNPAMRDYIDNKIKSCKSFVVVGWRHDSDPNLLEYLSEYGDIVLVEIFGPNINIFLFSQAAKFPLVTKIVHNDIKNLKKLFNKHQIDCIIWQHGPELIPYEEAVTLIKDMKLYFDEVILDCSKREVGNKYATAFGNPNEYVYHQWTEQELQDLGFKTVDYISGIIGVL